MREAVLEISRKGFGCVAIVSAEGLLEGIITDGDLRRHMDGLMNHTAGEVMTAAPQTVSPDTLAAEALKLMEDRRITVLFVIERGRPAGILHIHDILRAGVV
jgi:arabinose-5-phosphate isomerase